MPLCKRKEGRKGNNEYPPETINLHPFTILSDAEELKIVVFFTEFEKEFLYFFFLWGRQLRKKTTLNKDKYYGLNKTSLRLIRMLLVYKTNIQIKLFKLIL